MTDAFVHIVGSKAFGNGLRVLDDVNLSVAKGEVTVVIGPSGSGKTTMLRALALLTPLDTGFVRVEGRLHGYREVRGGYQVLPERALVKDRLKVGMVFQSFNLFPHRTALENVMIAPVKVLGRRKSEVEQEARALLARVGLAAKADTHPAQLSGGQQQRVAIARALAMKPKLMLFDEPTSALDPETVHEVLNTMKELADSGMTMVIASHEMGFARQAADRVVFMDAGLIVEQGDPEQFFIGDVQPRVRDFLDKIL
ncbi:MAG: amino acid ABC transporter ATP-binding protein [Jiangellaceae bacterium]